MLPSLCLGFSTCVSGIMGIVFFIKHLWTHCFIQALGRARHGCRKEYLIRAIGNLSASENTKIPCLACQAKHLTKPLTDHLPSKQQSTHLLAGPLRLWGQVRSQCDAGTGLRNGEPKGVVLQFPWLMLGFLSPYSEAEGMRSTRRREDAAQSP